MLNQANWIVTMVDSSKVVPSRLADASSTEMRHSHSLDAQVRGPLRSKQVQRKREVDKDFRLLRSGLGISWIVPPAMPTFIRGLRFDIPLLNSSCPWASDIDDLKSLYASSFTGGVTTRTATLKGFPDDPKVHQVGSMR